MKITSFNKGIIASSSGSLWWGFIGTYYFQYITFVGTLEVVVHRCIWTTLILLITTTFFNKWHLLKKIINDLDNDELINLSNLLDLDDENLYKLNQGLTTSINIAENKVTKMFKEYKHKK